MSVPPQSASKPENEYILRCFQGRFLNFSQELTSTKKYIAAKRIRNCQLALHHVWLIIYVVAIHKISLEEM